MNSLLRRTNASKLNKLVEKKQNNVSSYKEDIQDTNLDLLIDRIHDLSSEAE